MPYGLAVPIPLHFGIRFFADSTFLFGSCNTFFLPGIYIIDEGVLYAELIFLCCLHSIGVFEYV